MVCGCIAGRFDFTFGVRGEDHFIYQDLSVWEEGEGYQIPPYYTVRVKSPTAKDYKDIQVRTGGSFLIDKAELGVTGCIPDGVYCFRVESGVDCSSVGCGLQYDAYRMLTTLIECRLMKSQVYYMDGKGEIPSEKSGSLDLIDMKIESSKFQAEIGNFSMAQDEYKVANKMLDILNCENSCGCG